MILVMFFFCLDYTLDVAKPHVENVQVKNVCMCGICNGHNVCKNSNLIIGINNVIVTSTCLKNGKGKNK
jgi:phosphoribosylformylglycinamidine (FGAM) synthase-like amidotransferase family enzyme